MGLFGLLHFVVWFLMLVSVFNADRAGKEIKENKVARSRGGEAPLRDSFLYQLIKVSVFTSALTSLLAIFQHFFSLSDLLPQADRVYSLIGNAGVLGSYSIFNIFLAGYLAISSFRESNFGHWNLGFFWKFVIGHLNFFGYCFLFLVSCWALALTGTRGAWLGLLAGIIVFSILSFFIPPAFISIMLLGSVIFSSLQIMRRSAAEYGVQITGALYFFASLGIAPKWSRCACVVTIAITCDRQSSMV